MSSVYLAEHATLRSKAAVKVLPRKRVSQTSYLARFEQEARLAARLNHPNIVRTFDLDTEGTVHYIAMEYVEGTDLHAKVKREGPLPVRQAADFIRQAAAGLEYAHDEGLVHRDIKPANLMLDIRGTIKVLDLGLALAVTGDEEDGSLTREHNEKVIGTADYLAPEQATDSHKADRRSDIYSLGCTLYYLLVGRAPFAQGKLAERIQAHVKKPPPNLLDERPDVPAPLVDLYFRMMEKHPDSRPQTAQEVADTLGAWLKASAGKSQGGGPAGPPRRGPPRRGDGGGSGPAPVFRHGPGSGSSSSVSLGGQSAPRRPGGPPDSGSLVFTPPPGSGGPRPAGKKPAARPAPAQTAKSGSAAEDSTDRRPRRKKPLKFAGQPLGFWLVAAGGLVAAAVLATLLYLRNR